MDGGPADTAAAIVNLERVLGVPGLDYTVRSWRDDRFGAVNLLSGLCGNLDQPAVQGKVVLFLDGEVNNLDEVVGTGAAIEGAPASPAGVCLDLYLSRGDEFVRQLCGQFNILVYDSSHNVVKLFNDRMAYRPFYYWCENGLAVFALEKKALFTALGRTPPLDPAGVLQFMAFGHNLNEDTVFSGVKTLPPACVLRFEDGRGVTERYWKAAYAPHPSTESSREAAAEFGRRLCRAVERSASLDRRYGIFLSGGLDSRAAAGGLARTGKHIEAVTFGGDESADLRYGRTLAERFGFVHHQLQYAHTSLADIMPRIVWRTEGAIPFNETLSIAHHRFVRSKADVIVTGHFGDALSGGHILPGQLLARDMNRLTEHIVDKRSILHLPMLRSLMNKSFVKEAYPEMVGGITKTLVEFGEERLPKACNLWDMTVRQTRFTFCSPAIDRYLFEPLTPFTDNEVVEWLLVMPTKNLFGQKVYKRMIIDTFPEIADVPWASTDKPVPANFAFDMAEQAWQYAAKHFRRKTASRPVPVDERVRDFSRFAAGSAAQDALPGELFDRDAVAKAARSAEKGTWPAYPLYLLMTLSECARLFGASGPSEPPAEASPLL